MVIGCVPIGVGPVPIVIGCIPIAVGPIPIGIGYKSIGICPVPIVIGQITTFKHPPSLANKAVAIH